MGQNKEELLETKRYAGAYTLKELRDGKWNEENDFGSPRAAITEACTDFEQCQKERDHFKAAYERKLVEHAETLSQAQRVCEERDEWRQKALDVAERLAAAEETLKRESEQARAARTMLAKGWPAAKSWLDSNMEMERAQFADRLAAAEGHAQKLREALETIDGALPYFHPKFVQDQAARARKIAADALAGTPRLQDWRFQVAALESEAVILQTKLRQAEEIAVESRKRADEYYGLMGRKWTAPQRFTKMEQRLKKARQAVANVGVIRWNCWKNISGQDMPKPSGSHENQAVYTILGDSVAGRCIVQKQQDGTWSQGREGCQLVYGGKTYMEAMNTLERNVRERVKAYAEPVK